MVSVLSALVVNVNWACAGGTSVKDSVNVSSRRILCSCTVPFHYFGTANADYAPVPGDYKPYYVRRHYVA